MTFNHRFPGQYKDSETGLSQNWHREYEAMLGRYATSDPKGLDAGTNTYSYALGRPIGESDRSGLDTLTRCEKEWVDSYYGPFWSSIVESFSQTEAFQEIGNLSVTGAILAAALGVKAITPEVLKSLGKNNCPVPSDWWGNAKFPAAAASSPAAANAELAMSRILTGAGIGIDAGAVPVFGLAVFATATVYKAKAACGR